MSSPSRNGFVLRFVEPVMITYLQPKNRVLFNQARGCNPFFHVYEALWMLAGRNDVEPLAYYNSKMRDYSDDGSTFNGAYGHRWRHAYANLGSIDQLKIIIDHLKTNTGSRRAVLHMSNVRDDLLKMDATLDQCCNTQVYFDIVDDKLNMTVCNRSNDMVWGMLGANVVHFSFLQEYMATCIGVDVGVYNQFTNNLHVYTERFTPKTWLADNANDYHQFGPCWRPFPLVERPEVFDEECKEFVERHKQDALFKQYKEPFLHYVAQPMCIAFHYHKRRKYDEAMQEAKRIRADDWRVVCMNWLQKRERMWRARTA